MAPYLTQEPASSEHPPGFAPVSSCRRSLFSLSPFKADSFFATFFFGVGFSLANVFVAGFLSRAPIVQAQVFLSFLWEGAIKLLPDIGN
jgi:hypothetical protein